MSLTKRTLKRIVRTRKQRIVAVGKALKLLGSSNKNKYRIKTVDGEKPDRKAVYLVLRLDKFGKDLLWARCCRDAARALSKSLKQHGMGITAKQIRKALAILDDADINTFK